MLAGAPTSTPQFPPAFAPPPGYVWQAVPLASAQLPTPQTPLQLPAPPQNFVGAPSAPPQPGVYAMPTSASLGRPDVVTGTLPVDSHDALVLFDSGATYSFVSLEFANKAKLSRQEIGQSVVVSSPAGPISSSIVCPGCVISIDNEDFVANLMVIPLKPFDVILGMDWLHRYRAVISCFWKTVSLQAPCGEELIFQGTAPPHSLFVLASLFPGQRAVKTGFLLALADTPSTTQLIEAIPVV
jgi:hypothetical protein